MGPWLQLILPPFGLMLFLYAYQRRSGNAGIADAGWAFCMAWVAVAWSEFALRDGMAWPRIALVAAMAVFWASRLGLFLLLNRVLGRPEDIRYAAIRTERGEAKAQRIFLGWFLAQAPFALLFGLCFFAAMRGRGPESLALLVYLVAIGGELLADAQLARFRADPANRGTTCRQGLWRYSRHPNYFFEWIHWFTYVVLAWGSGTWFFLSWIGPVLMLLMLYRVSGIPLTEKRALASRGDDYREYQRTTSAFIPWFPKPSNR